MLHDRRALQRAKILCKYVVKSLDGRRNFHHKQHLQWMQSYLVSNVRYSEQTLNTIPLKLFYHMMFESCSVESPGICQSTLPVSRNFVLLNQFSKSREEQSKLRKCGNATPRHAFPGSTNPPWKTRCFSFFLIRLTHAKKSAAQTTAMVSIQRSRSSQNQRWHFHNQSQQNSVTWIHVKSTRNSRVKVTFCQYVVLNKVDILLWQERLT